MEDKLNAIEDAIDFIDLAMKEIEDYSDLTSPKYNLDEVKMNLMEIYREIEEEIQEQEDINYDMKLAYMEGRL